MFKWFQTVVGSTNLDQLLLLFDACIINLCLLLSLLYELFDLVTCSCGVRTKIKAKMLEGSEGNRLVKQERGGQFRFFCCISNATTKLVAVFPLQQLCCVHFVITSSVAHLTVITSSPIAICVELCYSKTSNLFSVQ